MSEPPEPTKPEPITMAGGWCAPISAFYDITATRGGIGGIQFRPLSPEEQAKAEAERKQWLHDTRWKRRRNLVKGWLLLRPIRNRIHDHIHRHCDEDY